MPHWPTAPDGAPGSAPDHTPGRGEREEAARKDAAPGHANATAQKAVAQDAAGPNAAGPNAASPNAAAPDAAGTAPAREGQAASRDSASGVRRVFRHANYRLFFAGQAISLVGTWMQAMAQSWLVYRLSGSSLALGMLGFAGQLPIFVFAVFGGALADVRDRRAILVGTQLASMLLAFAAAALTMTGVVQVWHVFVLATALGIVNAFDVPARQAFVMDMVGREDLPAAIGLNSSMFNGARLIGPTVAGAVVALAGEGWCFLLNGLSFVAVIAGLLMMRLTPQPAAHQGTSTLHRIREGLVFSLRHSGIRATLLLVGTTSLFGMIYSVLLPIIADKALGGDAATLGLLMGAVGAGALAGAIALALRSRADGLFRWLLRAVTALGACLALFSRCTTLYAALPTLALVGFCVVVLMASANTLLQTMSPDAYRGRVMALFSMMFMGMAPFGALLAGTAAHAIGPQNTILLSGVACLCNAVWFGLWLRQHGGSISPHPAD